MTTGTVEGKPHLPSRDPAMREALLSQAGHSSECGIETVYVIDDDCEARAMISRTLASPHRRVLGFASSAEYRSHQRLENASCLVLEMRCVGVDGFELQEHSAADMRLPTIFVSGDADIPSTVRAMKAGAINCLTKPIDREALLDAVTTALAHDRRLRIKQLELARLRQRLSTLTKREREVLPLVVGGALNKEAAAILGISEVTLQIHRSQVMRKMQAKSVADLVRMNIKLRLPHWHGYA